MLKNSLKVVILGVVGFAFLVYFTMPKNPNAMKEVSAQNILNIDSIPKYFEVVGNNSYVKFDSIFEKGVKNIVLIANISNTPWLIKQLAVNGKLEEMYKESKIPLINDSNGAFMNSLALNDNTQNKYIIFKLKSDGNIEKLKEGFVELNILEKGISAEDSKKSLEEIIKIF